MINNKFTTSVQYVKDYIRLRIMLFLIISNAFKLILLICLCELQEGNNINVFEEWMPGGSIASLLDKHGAFTQQVVTPFLLLEENDY